jgi:hypothetical protein
MESKKTFLVQMPNTTIYSGMQNERAIYIKIELVRYEYRDNHTDEIVKISELRSGVHQEAVVLNSWSGWIPKKFLYKNISPTMGVIINRWFVENILSQKIGFTPTIEPFAKFINQPKWFN